MTHPHTRPTPPATEPPAPRRKTVVLLGFAQGFAQGFELPQRCQNVAVQHLSTLTPTALAELLPDAIALPLFDAQTDASAQLQLLHHLGFRGRCFVLTPPLPNPILVLRELRAEARGLRITLLNALSPIRAPA